MKLITSTALALAAAALATPAAAQYSTPSAQQQQPAAQQVRQAAPTVTPSPKAAKAIYELQDALNKKDYANISAKITAAQSVASTKEDRYLIGSFQFRAARATNDAAGALAGLDAIAQSGYLDSLKVASLYVDLGSSYFQAKDYPRAVTALQKAKSLNPANADAADLLGRSQFLAGQKAEAAATFGSIIQKSSGQGQKPSEETYKLAVQSALDAKSPQAVNYAQEWLAAYPNSDSWRASLAIYRNANHLDTEGTLDVLRLMQATGSLQQPADYELFAAADAEQNNYNEAQAVLDAGVAAHVIDPSATNMRETFSVVRAKPKATAADLAAATKSAQTGTALLHIGDRYYAMGDYSKAVELYRQAQGKSDVDPNVARLHIGMALARAGDKAGATAALNSVTGARADVAKFWLTYVNQKG